MQCKEGNENMYQLDLNSISNPGNYVAVDQTPPEPLKVKKVVEWTSVEVQLPTEPRACWISGPDGILPGIALYHPEEKIWTLYPPYLRYTPNYITHWAPVEIDES